MQGQARIAAGSVGELALASAEGTPGAEQALADLHRKISATQFEIDSHIKARELASRLDQDAATAWKQEALKLPRDELVAGIGKECCPRRCSRGVYCVITMAAGISADPACAHPILSSQSSGRAFHPRDADHQGKLLEQRYNHPAIQANYAAARKKLKV